jgi:hypothetical protein
MEPVKIGQLIVLKFSRIYYNNDNDVTTMPLLFLLQAFRAQNIESAKSRLTMCADDIREELKSSEDNLDLCSQLGAVLGMLGDCWYVLTS